MSYRQLTAEQHIERAEHHRAVGEALIKAANHEWASVPYFYSAYHLVKHALLTDPVFDDPTKLAAIKPGLDPGHRYAVIHQARKSSSGPRDFGVNDLVLWLYRASANDYDILHKASCAVRYDNGIEIPLERIAAAYESVRAAHTNAELVA